MRLILLVMAVVIVSGCGHLQTSSAQYSPIAKFVTPDVVNANLLNRAESAPAPEVTRQGDHLVWNFDGHCTIENACGGKLLTDDLYRSMRTNVFARILESVSTDVTFPNIGSRAIVQGLDKEIVTFTTTDRRFDIQITPATVPVLVNAVGIAKDLSHLYDKLPNTISPPPSRRYEQ